jgi:hypothetical protein
MNYEQCDFIYIVDSGAMDHSLGRFFNDLYDKVRISGMNTEHRDVHCMGEHIQYIPEGQTYHAYKIVGNRRYPSKHGWRIILTHGDSMVTLFVIETDKWYDIIAYGRNPNDLLYFTMLLS